MPGLARWSIASRAHQVWPLQPRWKALDTKEKLDVNAIDPMQMSPDEFCKYIRAEVVRWTALAKDRKTQIEE